MQDDDTDNNGDMDKDSNHIFFVVIYKEGITVKNMTIEKKLPQDEKDWESRIYGHLFHDTEHLQMCLK